MKPQRDINRIRETITRKGYKEALWYASKNYQLGIWFRMPFFVHLALQDSGGSLTEKELTLTLIKKKSGGHDEA